MTQKATLNKVISVPKNKRWEAENDMRTLLEAQKIQSDPKRMGMVKTIAKELNDDTTKIIKKA